MKRKQDSDEFYPGRYISKRERKDNSQTLNPPPSEATRLEPIPPFPRAIEAEIEKRKLSNTCQSGNLFATAGMDSLAAIWSPWTHKTPIRVVKSHLTAVQDLAWSPAGTDLISGSFDKTAKLTDIESGQCIRTFDHTSTVNCVQFWPSDSNLFAAGESEGGKVKAWDLRCPGGPTWALQTAPGRILDLQFSADGSKLLTSLYSCRKGGMDQPISVWDARKQLLLASQIYMEGYICPSLRVHPSQNAFVAQSHGGYMAQFSLRAPFKMSKGRRFEGHHVGGFRIHCSFSADGSILASGSSDGKAYFYSWKTGKILKVLEASSRGCCVDASWHPLLPSTVATCAWDGTVAVWE